MRNLVLNFQTLAIKIEYYKRCLSGQLFAIFRDFNEFTKFELQTLKKKSCLPIFNISIGTTYEGF